MMAPTLEGFYFDPRKEKYFKILPHHIAPRGAVYSEQAIRKQDEKNQDKKELEAREAHSRVRIQASPIFLNPLCGTSGIRREMGGLSRSAVVDAMNANWALGLKKQIIFNSTDEIGSLPQDIITFARDDATGIFIYGPYVEGDHQYRDIYQFVPGSATKRPERFSSHFDSRLTSISLSPSRVFIITTLGGSLPATFHFQKLPDPGEYRQLAGERYSATCNYEHVLKGDKPQIQWSSASRPDSTSAVFAVGANNQVSVIRNRQETWNMTAVDCLNGDAYSVDWLSHEVLMSGHGSGEVCLWDIRARGSAARLRFSRSINHVRKLNEHQVVVSGKAKSIRIYDLRYLAKPDPVEGTAPRLQFPTFTEFCYDPFRGFDVCGNLIAAANRDAQLQLFDAGSGKELQIGEGRVLPEPAFSISCLKFAEAVDGSGMKLYGSVDDVLKEWSCCGIS